MPRCPNGTRRCPPKTGTCQKNKTRRTSEKNKTSSRRSSPTNHPVSFIEFCKIASELYGVKYSFCRQNGVIRTIYYSARDKSRIVYPKKLNMIGSPADEDIIRKPFNKQALKKKTGITANVIVR
jgi:hypothetical protein